MVFKCKMCGGTLEFKSGDTVATCDSCGTLQTLPKMDDEHRVNLYDRANHYRRANEFDKAMGIYEQILNEDRTDAESYWSLVLCRYGIEYVEDPRSHKRVPTVNRAQYTSIYDDADYKSALQYATVEQKKVYEEEAEKINEIQKGILAISQKEEPFDVFICYKETDANGRRTQDSVLANDLYHQLTQEGFKVFFSRITLEDKLGTAYEPYIFAALNSAKVMVVLGTKEEYFNAVWVKNEWSRFLALIRDGKKKILIPAYRDMDPYDLPEEFSHLQAQDMSKLGFMQDLIRGIKKLVGEKKALNIQDESNDELYSQIDPLIKRAHIFLEDEEWNRADEYAERVLDIEPECAEAYFVKMLAELHVPKMEQLSTVEECFENNKNYQKYILYVDEEKRKKTEQLVYNIKSKPIYEEAILILRQADTAEECQVAKKKFEGIEAYEDSGNQIRQCEEKIAEIMERNYNKLVEAFNDACVIHDYEVVLEQLKKICDYRDSIEYMMNCAKHIDYLNAMELMEIDNVPSLDNAKELLLGIDGFMDSNDKIAQIDEKIDFILRREARKKKIKIISGLAIIIAIAIGIIILVVYDVKSKQAEIDIKKGNFDGAISIYEGMGEKEKANDLQYKQLDQLIRDNEFEKAVEIYNKFDKKDQAKEEFKYFRKKMAEYYVSLGQYDKAYQIHKNGGDKEEQKWVLASKAADYYKAKKYSSAIKIYKKIGAYEMVKQIKKEMAKQSK